LIISLEVPKTGENSTVNYNTPFSNTWPLSGYCRSSAPCNCNADSSLVEGICFDSESGDFKYVPVNCSERGLLSFKVKQYGRSANGNNWLYLGSVRREFVIKTEVCVLNNSPVFENIKDTAICEGDSVCLNFKVTDEEFNGFNPQGWKDTIDVQIDGALKGAHILLDEHYNDTVQGSIYAVREGRVCWQSSKGDGSEIPRRFTLTATDKSCPIPAKTISSFKIKVKISPRAKPTITRGKCGFIQMNANTKDSVLIKGGTYTRLWEITPLDFPDSVIFTSDKINARTTIKDTGVYIVSYFVKNSGLDCDGDFIHFDTIYFKLNDSFSHVLNAKIGILSPDTQCRYNNSYDFADSSIILSGSIVSR
jgi:hypothetical protein